MIIYESTTSGFLDDVANKVIVDRLYNVYSKNWVVLLKIGEAFSIEYLEERVN